MSSSHVKIPAVMKSYSRQIGFRFTRSSASVTRRDRDCERTWYCACAIVNTQLKYVGDTRHSQHVRACLSASSTCVITGVCNSDRDGSWSSGVDGCAGFGWQLCQPGDGIPLVRGERVRTPMVEIPVPESPVWRHEGLETNLRSHCDYNPLDANTVLSLPGLDARIAGVVPPRSPSLPRPDHLRRFPCYHRGLQQYPALCLLHETATPVLHLLRV